MSPLALGRLVIEALWDERRRVGLVDFVCLVRLVPAFSGVLRLDLRGLRWGELRVLDLGLDRSSG